MWKGTALEILGLWLIVTALMHHSPDTTAWINLFTGGAVAILGASFRRSKPWQGLTAGIAGLLLFFMAFVPQVRVHHINLWIDLIAGILIWFSAWRIVSSEKGGPWRIKDGPLY